MKICTKCGEEKPAAEYYRQSRAKDGRMPRCKVCHLAEKAEHHAKPEVKKRRAAYIKEWQERPDVKVRRQKYRDDNREQQRAHLREYQSRPEVKAARAEYIAANLHVNWENGYKQRAKRYGFEPIIEPFTQQDLIAKYGDACVDCGAEWTDVDHVVPVRMGGAHSLDNCQPVCSPCNSRRWSVYKKEAYDLLRDIYSGEEK